MKSFLLQKKQFLLYCLIGAGCTGLDFLVYTCLLRGGWMDYQAANLTGYAVGTLVSFFLNSFLNFRTTDRLARRMAAFFLVGFIGYLASAGLLHWLVAAEHCNKYLAKAFTLVVVVLIQFNLNKLISFRKAR